MTWNEAIDKLFYDTVPVFALKKLIKTEKVSNTVQPLNQDSDLKSLVKKMTALTTTKGKVCASAVMVMNISSA